MELFAAEPGVDCPIEQAVDSIADKWKLRILIALGAMQVVRFNDLQRKIGGISPKVLTNALRELETDGLVQRDVFAEIPPRVEYRPTARAERLFPILSQLQDWAAIPSAVSRARASALRRAGSP